VRRHVTLLSFALLCGSGRLRAQKPPYKNPALSTAVRVRDLLARMTPEEKFWQLWMVPGDLDSGTAVYKHGVFGLQVREHGDDGLERDPGAAARRMAVKLNAT
jgi:beta-glucosidase